MNLFTIKQLISHNKTLFRISKACFHALRGIVQYSKNKRDAENKLIQISAAYVGASKVIWYFGVAAHPNLGDLAQTHCTLEWLKCACPELPIVEIPSHIYNFMKDRLETTLEESIRQQDLLIFQSGYTMTGVHDHEAMRQYVLKAFPNNRVVLLPQTICYQSKEKEQAAQKTYRDCNRMLMLARDRVSYDTAVRLFGNTKVALYPDIVTTLIGKYRFSYPREGILCCMRNDWERLYKRAQVKAMIAALKKLALVSITDTTVHIKDTQNREDVWKRIYQTIAQYARHRLIITDRYHGTIFSLAAGTPVIVLKTTDHKVITGVQWFTTLYPNYIFAAENLEDAERLAEQILQDDYQYCLPEYFEQNYYSKLYTLLQEKTDENYM